MDWITYATNQTVDVTIKSMDDVDYLVAPVVMLVAGVLNDDELVPVDELAHHFRSWNGRPVVINHPKNNRGNFISANDPEVLASVMVGTVYDTFIENDSLKGQIWINMPLADGLKEGKEIVNRLKSGEPLEVSTAYLRDVEDLSGTFNGQAYSKVTRNISPDHLALLPNAEGACSWSDGCGTPRVNKEVSVEGKQVGQSSDQSVDQKPNRLKQAFDTILLTLGLKFNDEGLEERARRIRDAWFVNFRNGEDFDEFSDPWPRAVLEDRLIVETELGLLAYPYTINDDSGEVEFSDPAQVEIQYIEKGKVEDSNMSLVDQIVSGGLGLTAEDLEGMPESGLAKLAEKVVTNESDEELETNEQDDTPDDVSALDDTVCKKLETLAKSLDRFGGAEAFAALVDSMQSNVDAERGELITDLVANETITLTKEQLGEMSTDALTALHKSLMPANYGGQGGGPAHSNEITTIELSPMFVERR